MKAPLKEIEKAERLKKEYLIEKMEGSKMKNITDFEDILKEKYGEKGSSARDKFDGDSLAYIGCDLSDSSVRRL